MLGFLGGLWSSFLLGVLTPLGAVCVLPLFPGYLAYLSNSLGENTSRKGLALLGLLMSAGVISFMMLIGLIFTTFLQKSLTNVIQKVSPAAFVLLAIISLLLIFDVDFSRFSPHIQAPVKKNPLTGSFLFGFFFGAIVLPCNPGFIAAFFAKSVLVESPITNLLNFFAFGLGLSSPLLAFSLISGAASKQIIGFFIRYKRWINFMAGAIMLVISIYYLVNVFRIHEVFL